MEDIKMITLHNGDYGFPFFGFDYVDDYLFVADILKSKFNVNDIEYTIVGFFDEFRGFFIHDDYKYIFDCYDMMGVIISFPKGDSENVIRKKYNFINSVWHECCETKGIKFE